MSITDIFIASLIKQEEMFFRRYIEEFANPPIKGEITKGKIRYRGIKIVQVNNGFQIIKWLEQRGKEISPKIVINFNINL
jgi:hypothetical protein